MNSLQLQFLPLPAGRRSRCKDALFCLSLVSYSISQPWTFVRTKHGCSCDLQAFASRMNFITVNSFSVKCDIKRLRMFTLESCEVHLQDTRAKTRCASEELIDGPRTLSLLRRIRLAARCRYFCQPRVIARTKVQVQI